VWDRDRLRVCFRWNFGELYSLVENLYRDGGLDLQNFVTCPSLPHRKHVRVSSFLCSCCWFCFFFTRRMRSIWRCMLGSFSIILSWMFWLDVDDCVLGLGWVSGIRFCRGRMFLSCFVRCEVVSFFIFSSRNERNSWNKFNVLCSKMSTVCRSLVESLLFPWVRGVEVKGIRTSCGWFVLMLFSRNLP